MQHLVVKPMLQLVERSKWRVRISVFDLVFHGRVTSASGYGHLIAQFDQPLKKPSRVLRLIEWQYERRGFLVESSGSFHHLYREFGKKGGAMA
jgi:hypothetical protein